MGFDTVPAAQRRNVNNIINAIVIFCMIALMLLNQYIPKDYIPMDYILIGMFAFCILTLYESRLELSRIKQIVKLIQAKCDSEKQYAEGKYNDSSVQFFIGSPTSINYSVSADGNKALAAREELNELLVQAMREESVKGYQLLIDEKTIILSKSFSIAFQLKVKEAERIYNILDRARKLVDGKPATDANVQILD